ncbi:MAG: hypothetical protein ACRD22_13140 [Terriglobia bacterium]
MAVGIISSFCTAVLLAAITTFGGWASNGGVIDILHGVTKEQLEGRITTINNQIAADKDKINEIVSSLQKSQLLGGFYAEEDSDGRGNIKNWVDGAVNYKCQPGFTAHQVGRVRGDYADKGVNQYVCSMPFPDIGSQ